MMIPNGWFVLQQPKYKMPSVFDLHERGRVLYRLVAGELYPDYRARGGEDVEDGLIRKIQLFSRIYNSDEPDNLLKPDGNRWQSEDDVWDCWIAYAGSETEARRVCQSMEAVLRPLPARLS